MKNLTKEQLIEKLKKEQRKWNHLKDYILNSMNEDKQLAKYEKGEGGFFWICASQAEEILIKMIKIEILENEQ